MTTAVASPTPRTSSTKTVRKRPLRMGTTLPLLVEPGSGHSLEHLCEWIGAHHAQVRRELIEHGAILFRGFPVGSAKAFERVARAIDDDLKNEYLGTSPRDALTDYVFSASELPGFYVIPQHCEMTFVATPPATLFFCCLRPPARGGETPIADARRVLARMDPEVRRRFEERGLRIVRLYDGPEAKRSSKLDPWKLKRWDEMFGTTDRATAEARAVQEGFEVDWLHDGRLRLSHTQPAVRRHPRTGEPAWFNHLQVFHASTGPSELRRAWERRHDARDLGLAWFARFAVTARRRIAGSLPLECTYADGREIPLDDVEHVRDVIWSELVTFAWQQGDVLAIDNRAVSHGRMPYRGERLVAVCWA